MYSPTTRVLSVLELLQSQKQISGTELARRLEVDLRTVRRYIVMLQDMGIPVESQRGRYGYYSLRPGFKLPPLMFTDEEALALTLGLLLSKRIGFATAAPAVEGSLAKIERVLPARLRERVQALQKNLTLDVKQVHTAPQQQIVWQIGLAVEKRQSINMIYQSWGGEVSRRMADPYGVVFRMGYWYLVAYCHLRQEMRSFRIDRLQEVELLEKNFDRPEDFDVLTYVLKSIAQTPSQWHVELLLHVDLAHAKEIVPPSLALLEQTEQGVLFRTYVDKLEWLVSQVLALGCEFTVISPTEFSEALRRIGERALRSVQSQSPVEAPVYLQPLPRV